MASAMELRLTFKRMIQEQKQTFAKTSSTVRIIDDPETVRRILRHQDQHALLDEISGPYPYRTVGHLLLSDLILFGHLCGCNRDWR
jgi:hypothetical protein